MVPPPDPLWFIREAKSPCNRVWLLDPKYTCTKIFFFNAQNWANLIVSMGFGQSPSQTTGSSLVHDNSSTAAEMSPALQLDVLPWDHCCKGQGSKAAQLQLPQVNSTNIWIFFDSALNRSSQQGKYEPSIRKLTLSSVRLPVLTLVITTAQLPSL